MNIDMFKSLFKYKSKMVCFIGVERECFICDDTGQIVPRAHDVLTGLEHGIELQIDRHCFDPRDSLIRNENGAFGYELSGSQIETRVGPCRLESLGGLLKARDWELSSVLGYYGLSALHTEVGPEYMPLDIYPDPSGRYQEITKNMPRSILLAACRVIGTHVHVGMHDHEMALRVYNYVTHHFADLCEMGNGSFGERLAIYRQMAPDFQPKPYKNWDAYLQAALEKGFAEDPRKCWTLIRISVHGTIEFRMFGATDSVDRIVGWATKCHQICSEAISKG